MLRLGMAYQLIFTDIRYLHSADIRYFNQLIPTDIRYFSPADIQYFSSADIRYFIIADIQYLYRLNVNRYRYLIFGKTVDISANPMCRFTTDMPSLVKAHLNLLQLKVSFKRVDIGCIYWLTRLLVNGAEGTLVRIELMQNQNATRLGNCHCILKEEVTWSQNHKWAVPTFTSML